MTREGGVQSLGPFFAEPTIEFASPMSVLRGGGTEGRRAAASDGGKVSTDVSHDIVTPQVRLQISAAGC
jgi:hypothetical protein